MMVGSHCYCYCYFFCLIFLLFHSLASPTLTHCGHDQKDALLEFKYEFPVLGGNPSANHTSLSSWNKSNDDCCSWESVKCDAKSGKVISLNLESISLNNSLKPNSALFKLHYLQNLTLRDCNLYGEIPSSLGNLSRLTNLDLLDNGFVGQFPASVLNLTQLIRLDLSRNKFSGNLPLDMSGFHNLKIFLVYENSFSGLFPTSLFTIPSLGYVDLSENQFKGTIEFGNTSSSLSLYNLFLGDNQFDGPIPESTCEFLNLEYLILSDNNLIGKIPRCISKLVNLEAIELSNNNLEGEVPSCLSRLTGWVKLSHNSFSSFEKSWQVINETQILSLVINSNSFRGPFPDWICKCRLLFFLDLSNNSFSGSIPSCLIVASLRTLTLYDNKFTGILPDIFVNATSLNALDVSRNQLEGKIPKSLIYCKSMVFMNLESNRIKDKFPSWLGSLPFLNVLILRSNQFYGPLYHRQVSIGFESLKVIDISHNDFTGTLPPFYFSKWREMAISEESDFVYPYMGGYIDHFYNQMEIVHKGVDTEFEQIRQDFRAIDFSGNKFCGNIPESIGLLKELRLLNFSGNAFTSNIPQSLANLRNLEELDLSRNQLSGQIPRDLGSLSFLSTMDFSHNNLEGPVPRGTQFQRQNCSSFLDNPKLYGLEEICGKTDHVLNPAPQETEELSEPEGQRINWIAAAVAYVPGVFCGLVIGHIFTSHKHEWFMEKFGRNKPRVVTTIRAR